jgi:dolichyl-phosphate-mannose-protein mannosyltransferase
VKRLRLQSLAPLALGAALILPGLGSGLWEPTELAAVDAARGGGSHPPLMCVLQSAGIRLLGAREAAPRLPVALTALACVALAAWIGTRALGRRAGLLGALVLVTSPAFLFEARLASSEILATTAGLCAWGGVVLLGRVPLAPLIGMSVAGLVVGTLAGGLLTGAALPLLASALTLSLAGPTARTGRIAAAAAGAVALGMVALLLRRDVPAAWIGGAIHGAAVPPSFDSALRTLAHGAFPWSGLLPVALLHLFTSTERPSAIARLQLLAVLSLGFAVALLASWRIHEIRYPALVASAMSIGVFLDDALRGEAGGPFAALLCGCGIAILARDLFLSPESLLLAQRLDGLTYPSEVRVQLVHLVAGLVFALLAWLGLLWWRKALAGLPAMAVAYAAFTAHVLMPALGRQFSSKGVVEAYQRVARAGEPLARYRGTGAGTALRELRSQRELLDFLRSPGRVFALVPPADLTALDQAARQQDVAYQVLDESSSRALLLSNRLGKGERDRNPLRRAVFRERTHPRHELSATFEDGVELIGFDLPQAADLGGRFRVALHFHVSGTLPAGWKLFVHFDGPAYRLIGDHSPLIPTQYWSRGDYIVDEHDVEVPRMTTPKGRYTAYVGFWPGGYSDKRLAVVQGPSDGAGRVRLGTLVIR